MTNTFENLFNINNDDIAESKESFCPVILLLDKSGSMDGTPIKTVNSCVKQMKNDLLKDELTAERLQLKIIPFDSYAYPNEYDWVSPKDIPSLHLQGDGGTSFDEALLTAQEVLENQKKKYVLESRSYHKPYIFILTDGEDTIDSKVINKTQTAINKNKFILNLISVASNAETAFKQIIPAENVFSVSENNLASVFKWLSASMISISNSRDASYSLTFDSIER